MITQPLCYIGTCTCEAERRSTYPCTLVLIFILVKYISQLFPLAEIPQHFLHMSISISHLLMKQLSHLLEFLYSPAAHGGQLLPMEWTYWPNICNINIIWRCTPCFDSWTFTNFGTLPATLATCQYCETHLEEASCRFLTFGKLPVWLARCQNW